MKTGLIAIACSAVTVFPAVAANVITNPGFELTAAGPLADSGGFEQWSSFTETANNSVIQTTVVRTGTQALALDAAAGANFSIIYQNTGDNLTTVAIENTTWNWSFWVYSATSGPDNFTYQFMPSNSLNQDQPGASGTVTASALLPNTWTLVSGSFTTTDFALDPTLMKVNFLSFPGAGTSTFYIDDVSLESVPEPAAPLLGALAFLTLLRRRHRG